MRECKWVVILEHGYREVTVEVQEEALVKHGYDTVRDAVLYCIDSDIETPILFESQARPLDEVHVVNARLKEVGVQVTPDSFYTKRERVYDEEKFEKIHLGEFVEADTTSLGDEVRSSTTITCEEKDEICKEGEDKVSTKTINIYNVRIIDLENEEVVKKCSDVLAKTQREAEFKCNVDHTIKTHGLDYENVKILVTRLSSFKVEVDDE